MTVRRIQRKTTSSWRIDFAYTCPISGARLRHRSTHNGITRREATDLERSIHAQLTEPPPEPETLAEATLLRDFAAHWLATRTPTLAASTRDKYESTCRNHLVPTFGHLPLAAITTHDVEVWVHDRMGESPKPRAKTLKNQVAVLRRIFTDAKKWGYATDNPVDRVAPIRPDPKKPRHTVPLHRIEDFVAVAKTHAGPAAAPLITALLTGMRLGEVAALTWGSLDFDARQIHVVASVTRGTVGTPKGKVARKVPMHPLLVPVLQAHKRTHPTLVFPYQPDPLRARDAKRIRDTPFLDSNRLKHPLRRVCTALGIEQVNIHGLRHSFGSMLAEADQHPTRIQALMGHADLKTTQQYLHTPDEALVAAIHALTPSHNKRGQDSTKTMNTNQSS